MNTFKFFASFLLVYCLFHCFSTLSVSSASSPDLPSHKTTANKWAYRAEFIRNMTIEAWNAYSARHWGMPYLVVSYEDRLINNGHTIIDSLSTLWAMNLTAEFAKAEAWITTEMNATRMMYPSIQKTDMATLPIGGLLSTYALTGRQLFLEKAKEMAAAIRTQNITQIESDFQGHQEIDNSIFYNNPIKLFEDYIRPRLAFRYYDDLLNETLAEEYAPEKFEAILQQTLAMDVFRATRGKNFAIKVKSYLQRGSQDGALFQDYLNHFEKLKAVGGIVEKENLGIAYSDWKPADDVNYNRYCSFGASFALAATAMPGALGNVTSWRLLDPSNPKEAPIVRGTLDHWRLAETWTQTCTQLAKYARIPSEYFQMNNGTTEPTKWLNRTMGPYHLGSDDAESFFTLWTLTGKEEYREEAWRLAQALEQRTRIEGREGFFTTINVHNPGSGSPFDRQKPEFISGTLKYLYLTFREDSLFPLDKWVFDSMGHPFPVCGTHERYPAKLCK